MNGRFRLRNKSIRKALKVTNIVIILATLVPFIFNTLYYNIVLNQYERIIENVYGANSLSSRLKGEIYTTVWNVVSGKTKFEDGTQYAIEVPAQLRDLLVALQNALHQRYCEIDRMRTELDQRSKALKQLLQ